LARGEDGTFLWTAGKIFLSRGQPKLVELLVVSFALDMVRQKGVVGFVLEFDAKEVYMISKASPTTMDHMCI